jgi:hypothetical protein
LFFRSLPRFDPYILETYLDDLRELKRQVYDLFKYKPELLPGPELSKGAAQAFPPVAGLEAETTGETLHHQLARLHG